MKIILNITIILLLSFLFVQCTSGIGGSDSFGLFYSDVTHSESRDTTIGDKTGQTCQVSFLSLVASGDNSIPQAALTASIREVYNVSYRIQSILLGLIWQKNCTIVHGR